MYLERYKACHTIFEGIPKLDLGGVSLRGLLLDKIDLESKVYNIISNDLLVKKFLPGAYCANETEAKSKLNEYINHFLLKACIPFAIISNKNFVPIGYVLCNSPLVNYKDSDERINDWTIDFWLGESVRGQRIMEHILYRVLGYLQSKEVDRVYMYVDKDNYPSIRIIEKCSLIHLGESGDGKLYKYGVKLKKDVSL
jgi:RimJ/RimL family protein N-acetyltransferase